MKRREFLKTAVGAGAGFCLFGCSQSGGTRRDKTFSQPPAYLKDYESLYGDNPHQASLHWFRDAKFGLFMHYGLYSQLGRGEWVMYNEKIPFAEYKKLKDTFRAEKFDPDFITDLALEAQMKYVNITSRHHDGFCLFDTKTSDYNSLKSPAKKDLIAPLAEQCRKKGLGLFLYYSYGADWRHPYFYPRKFNPIAQPAYDSPEPHYKWSGDEDFQKYIEDAHAQITELLTNYGPIAGIWLDPLMGYYGRYDLFPIEQTYAMIRKLQEQTLICFKQGVTGTEDFAAPERSGRSLTETIRSYYGQKAAEIAEHAWNSNKDKHNEICDFLQASAWGYNKNAKHKDVEQVIGMLRAAFSQNCNLLLNTGPLPDGSIHPEDVETLRQTGRIIRTSGWPV